MPPRPCGSRRRWRDVPRGGSGCDLVHADRGWRRSAESIYVTQGRFFSQAAVVTFGGAYAVLPYISQQAVEHYKWLKPTEMLDGLGMAETTPGPLIIVVQFVGFLAAYRSPEGLPPLAAGVLNRAVWACSPCFLYIFVGAPTSSGCGRTSR
jgi:chromate transporter